MALLIISDKGYTLGGHIVPHASHKLLRIPHEPFCRCLIYYELHIIFRCSTLIMSACQYLRPLPLHPFSYHKHLPKETADGSMAFCDDVMYQESGFRRMHRRIVGA